MQASAAPGLQRILIAPRRGAPLADVDSAAAVPGRGLVGDRYHDGCGTFSGRPGVFAGARELSLIGAEALSCCNTRLRREGRAALDAADLRRNLVVCGLDLRAMLGQELTIGEARLRIVSSCPPCGYLSRLLGVDAKAVLKGLGGVRAAVIDGGTLRAGATIAIAAAR